jgi:hypothetical protein
VVGGFQWLWSGGLALAPLRSGAAVNFERLLSDPIRRPYLEVDFEINLRIHSRVFARRTIENGFGRAILSPWCAESRSRRSGAPHHLESRRAVAWSASGVCASNP